MVTDREITHTVLSLELICGFCLGAMVIFAWCKMRKLNTLIVFMKKLLVLIGMKSLMLLSEASYMLSLKKPDWRLEQTVVITSCFEFLNWSCTQILIFIVAMRFYESSIPVRHLELSMRQQQEAQAGKFQFLYRNPCQLSP